MFVLPFTRPLEIKKRTIKGTPQHLLSLEALGRTFTGSYPYLVDKRIKYAFMQNYSLVIPDDCF